MLSVDATQMRLDGPQAHMQLSRDLRVGESCRHQLRHPGLSGCQSGRRSRPPEADPGQLVAGP